MSQDRFLAHYRLHAAPDTAAHVIAARAAALALEQSIEMPLEAVSDARVHAQVAGKVVSIEPLAGSAGQFDVTIALALETVGGQSGQLLNMACGNCSLQPDVELLDLELPRSFLDSMPGPRFGIAGWRRSVAGLPPASATGDDNERPDHALVEQPTRPLSCTALKPLGLDARALAALAYLFARAGIDVIKDDHGIADQAMAPFAQRVPLVQRAIERANRDKDAAGGELRGHHSIYAPSLSGGPRALTRQLSIAREEGVGALLCCPLLLGVPVFAEMIRADAGVPLLAHPALGGLRIAPSLLLGRLFRLFGADAIIFPNHGGRFALSPDECRLVARRAREPAGSHRRAMPVPAGGMRIERIEEIIGALGNDTMLLIGGDLLRAGAALPERAAEFVRRIAKIGDAPPADHVTNAPIDPIDDGTAGKPARALDA